ncbi:terpene cyclase/mutase family protein [Aspergillus fischeri NRRL 181]|uniref:Terpene cyclase/mutase family member n=1 Tax=Neosartorya fischeri (strain ATCC 1020 / DSM 3700 / CBS 544.65 / FGSC A1164 / JCM 1740 / NRRL 181 / WB 181) TaxID=331117 RepID=A1D8P1_NEOFI|nr:squalene-hopene-cyclase, putative [Aspergillus fischeri NRRL 181]EAW20752.1 squalene-hopene-cyclase, putative [Aspergillus fischeri NRRL 181]
MLQTEAITTEGLRFRSLAPDDPLLPRVKQALKLSGQHSREEMHSDGHWCGEVKTNATTSAEHVLLCQALDINLDADREAFISWFRCTQGADGGWSTAPDQAGDISVTVEAYLALKILGLSEDDAAMRSARDFAIAAGGVARVRIFTRIYLAMFGLFPWAAVPELPPELILLPSRVPVSIYHWSAWARATVVPLLIISHHRPIYALPGGKATCSDYLDELWCDPRNKMVPYNHDKPTAWRSDPFALIFTLADSILHRLDGLRSFNPLRRFALRKCVDWILEHQEDMGDIGDIMPPLHGAMLALRLEGYPLHSDPIHRGLEAIERFAYRDQQGKRIQTTVSAFWDTSLMLVALGDAGMASSPWLTRSLGWLQQHQRLGNYGDWKVNNPGLKAGGFSFGYFNTWYPDVDDTASAVLAIIRQDERLVCSASVLDALNWLLGMQNTDGGWGAFDRDNNKLFLNKIPFSDMEAFCDPSTPDVTGHVLEAFGIFLAVSARQQSPTKADVLTDRIVSASRRAICYLSDTHVSSGGWYGRWGCNYIYGTSAVLCALAYFGSKSDTLSGVRSVKDAVNQAIRWLETVQNQDGGWGETVNSYKDPSRAGSGPSTASQTAWAIMALLPYLPPSTEVIQRGVEYLLRTQTKTASQGATWHEKAYTGTGFPKYFYMGYSFYCHYFPMMALGRYAYPCPEWHENWRPKKE